MFANNILRTDTFIASLYLLDYLNKSNDQFQFKCEIKSNRFRYDKYGDVILSRVYKSSYLSFDALLN